MENSILNFHFVFFLLPPKVIINVFNCHEKRHSQEEPTFRHGANSATHSGDKVLNSERLNIFFVLFKVLG